MFILRKITENGKGVSMNMILGKSYTYVGRFDSKAEEFRKCFKLYFGKDHVADLCDTSDNDTKRCYGFITDEGGQNIHPIWLGQKTYVMTSDGNTFANLTVK